MSSSATVRLLYFAWVREKTGLAAEEIALPAGVRTVADLIAWQQTRGQGYAEAFARASIIRTALDRRHVPPSTAIGSAREIAFFPPVTGG